RLINRLARLNRDFKLRWPYVYFGPAFQGDLYGCGASNGRLGGPHGAVVVGVSASVLEDVPFRDRSPVLRPELGFQNWLGRFWHEVGITRVSVVERDRKGARTVARSANERHELLRPVEHKLLTIARPNLPGAAEVDHRRVLRPVRKLKESV